MLWQVYSIVCILFLIKDMIKLRQRFQFDQRLFRLALANLLSVVKGFFLYYEVIALFAFFRLIHDNFKRHSIIS
jgi:hypothetical protein